MKKLFLIIFLVFDTCLAMTEAPYVITFYIKPLSEKPREINNEINKLNKRLQIPGYLNNSLIKHQEQRSQSLNGIYATYLGVFNSSDSKGQITFPRRFSNTEVNLLITPSIQFIPQAISPNTIKSLTLKNLKNPITGKDNYKFYKLKLIEDSNLELYYWNITQEKLKYNNIPLNTIIIYASPKNIIVPTGPILNEANIKLNQTRTNLVLPDIYASQKINKPLNALKFIKLKRLFEPVENTYKYEPDQSRYATMIGDKY